MLRDDMGQNSIITNANGVKGNTQTLKQLCDEMGFKTPADIDYFLSVMRVTIKESEWKEKFLRYIYNKDVANAKKYHDKLTDRAGEAMEDYREDSDTTKISIDNKVNGKEEPTIATGESGFLTFCDEMKKAFEFREELLQVVPLCI